LKLLLDTHVFLWSISEPDRVSQVARTAIAAPENRVFLSVASLWEIAIKNRKGQLRADENLPEFVAAHADLTLLPISAEHVWRVRRLPRLHGDPFDHLLVAQAISEDMTLITHDRALGDYGVGIIRS
jgi:PIN domain nuclease of toxin-antitoxin system